MAAQSTYSLVFNGSSGFVDSASAPVTFGGPFTLSVWAETTNTTQSGTVLAISIAGGTTTHCRIMANNTGVWRLNTIDTGGGQNNVDSGAISSGVWAHLAVTKGSGAAGYEFFVNGVSQGTLTNAGSATLTVLSLGVLHYSFDLQFFDGKIDDVSVFNSVLTGTQIANIAGTPGVVGSSSLDVATISPVMLWRAEAGSGTNIADTSGNGNDGTIMGGVTWSSLNDVADPLQAAGGAFNAGWATGATRGVIGAGVF